MKRKVKHMKKASKAVKSELEKQYERLFPFAGDLNVPAVMPSQPYPDYPSPMRVVQTVTTYSACEDPIPNPYKRS
jgi:hypothetical protein